MLSEHSEAPRLASPLPGLSRGEKPGRTDQRQKIFAFSVKRYIFYPFAILPQALIGGNRAPAGVSVPTTGPYHCTRDLSDPSLFRCARAVTFEGKKGVKNLKKMLAIIAVLGIAAVTLFAGCQKQEAPKPAAPASAPTSTPTGTAAAPAAAPAK